MRIITDIHSHILPQLDDGSEDIKMSIDILRGLSSIGYKRVWTTPHISYLFPNNTKTISFALDTVREQIDREGIDIELNAAAEYLFDDNFVNVLSLRDDLLTLPGNHLLFEFSMHNEPVLFYKDVLFRLQMKGYRLILAHPERYLFLYDSFSKYEDLKKLGLLFQVNLLSFDGYYGKPAKKIAEKLAKTGIIDFLATDIHHSDQIELLRNRKIIKSVESIPIKNDIFLQLDKIS